MAMPKGYLTVKEASAKSGLSRAQISLLLRRGILKGEKPGHDWLVSIRSLDAYLNNRPKPGRKPNPKRKGA